MARPKPANPPPQHKGFVRITHKRCPACEDRGALSTDGRPLVISGGQLRGASSYVGLTKASAGCEVCGGQGFLPVSGLESIDPYALKRV
jgi:hypothetical protein